MKNNLSQIDFGVFIGNEQLDEYILKSRQRRALKTSGVLT